MAHFALIGRSLGHSFSKRYFDDLFSRRGLPHTYRLVEIPAITLLGTAIEENQLSGLNITIPYKEQVIPLLDGISAQAQAIGACNVVRVQGRQLIGFNTDAPAFQSTLEPLLKPCHTSALVLGTGGASKAVAYALRQLGIDHTLVSRTPEAGQLSYPQAAEQIQSHKLIINCTPVGTTPDIDSTPWPWPQKLTPDHLCYDLVYNPSATRFLREAQQQGAALQNGLAMLHAQADLSYQIWTE